MPARRDDDDLEGIHHHRPITEVFRDALQRYQEHPDAFEHRIVVARSVNVPEGDAITRDGLAVMRPEFDARHQREEELLTPICVLERADGSLWAYDDAHLITLYHRLAPDRRVRCAIIGRDPTPV